MKHNRFTFGIFLLCCALLLAAFAHMGWEAFVSYSRVEVIDRTMPACILTEDGRVFTDAIRIQGEQHDYIVNYGYDDQFLGAHDDSLRIGAYAPKFTGVWYPDKQIYYSQGYSQSDVDGNPVYENVENLLHRDLSQLLIQLDLQYIYPEEPSMTCLVVCPAADQATAARLLTFLDGEELPGEWNERLDSWISLASDE